jgi:hypothetical protein
MQNYKFQITNFRGGQFCLVYFWLIRMLKMAIQRGPGETKPQAYPLGYVEDFFEPRTKLGAIFSILLTLFFAAAKIRSLHPKDNLQ